MPFNTTSCTHLYHTMLHAKPAGSVFQPCYYPLQISDELLLWLIQAGSRHRQIQTDILKELLELDLDGRRPHTNRFYQALGLNPPELIIDSHNREGCLIADLNEDLCTQGYENRQFDLIVNNGTTEHIFDQRTVFTSIHKLCKTGGIMYHKTPIYNVLNISLYGNLPRFFHDLAIANDYKILGIFIGNRWGDSVPVSLDSSTPDPTEIFRPRLPAHPGHVRGVGIDDTLADELMPTDQTPESCRLPDYLTLSDYLLKSPLDAPGNRMAQICQCLKNRAAYFRPGNSGELYNLFILKKQHDEPFRVPYQGNNVKDIEDSTMQQRYQRQIDYAASLSKPPS